MPLFPDEKSITGEEPADEMGFGDKVCVTDPSGAYFLGLPLLFFIDKGMTPNGGGAEVDGGEERATWVVTAVDPVVVMWLGGSVLGASDPTTVTPPLFIPSLPSISKLNKN